MSGESEDWASVTSCAADLLQEHGQINFVAKFLLFLKMGIMSVTLL